jgi:hypothetical protein
MLASSCLAASSALVMEYLPSPGRSGTVHLRMGSNDSTSHYPTLVEEGKRTHNSALDGSGDLEKRRCALELSRFPAVC